MFMLTSNLFRALHPLKAHDQDSFDMDEEEPNLEPAWPHLQVGACGWAGGWAGRTVGGWVPVWVPGGWRPCHVWGALIRNACCTLEAAVWGSTSVNLPTQRSQCQRCNSCPAVA